MRSRPSNVYDMSDFRGLLHADYKETIKCAFTKNKGQKQEKELQLESSENQPIKQSAISTKNGTTITSPKNEFTSTQYQPNVFNKFVSGKLRGQDSNSRTIIPQQAISNNSYGGARSSQSTNTQVIKRPVTAFFAKKTGKNRYTTKANDVVSLSSTLRGGMNGARTSYNEQTHGDQQSNATGFYMSARNAPYATVDSLAVATDPEGVEALNAIDEFDNK